MRDDGGLREVTGRRQGGGGANEKRMVRGAPANAHAPDVDCCTNSLARRYAAYCKCSDFIREYILSTSHTLDPTLNLHHIPFATASDVTAINYSPLLRRYAA